MHDADESGTLIINLQCLKRRKISKRSFPDFLYSVAFEMSENKKVI